MFLYLEKAICQNVVLNTCVAAVNSFVSLTCHLHLDLHWYFGKQLLLSINMKDLL